MAASRGPVLIGVDWGTTNRRGYLIDARGAILGMREDALGLANVTDRRFQSAFDTLVEPWTDAHGPLPALLSGMAGASTGWREAPYCGLPAGIADLAGNLLGPDSDRPIWIVPGVATRGKSGMPDVIRGEEIQAIAAAGTDSGGLVVLPGTHSKWVHVKAGRIHRFKTYMTGDLHAAVLNHTVVALAAEDGSDNRDCFLDGVAAGRAQHGDLSHILFGARSRVLFGELDADAVSDYLSGLLIGAEIANASESFERSMVKLVGSDSLCALYSAALQHCGIEASRTDADAVGATYHALAVRAGILENGTR